MQLKSELLKKNKEYYLDRIEWIDYELPGQEIFDEMILDILKNNRKVMIDPDRDPDGIFLAKILQEFFKKVGFTNYQINSSDVKRHGISTEHIKESVRHGFDYVIIGDSSSNLEHHLLDIMLDNGVKVMVIDHHEVTLERKVHENYVLLNNNDGDEAYSWTSAGYYTFMLIKNLLDKLKPNRKFTDYVDLFYWGYITLISDSTSISNEYGAVISHYSRKYTNHVPALVRKFYTPWDIMSRQFLSFGFINKVNACIRFNVFDVIYKYFYNEDTSVKKEIEELYKVSKEIRDDMVYSSKVDIRNGLAVSNLTPYVDKNEYITTEVMVNFTGYVANKMAEETLLPTLTYVELGGDMCKGSVRDPYSRDLLKIFYHITTAGGHGAAFGLHFKLNEVERIIKEYDYYSDEVVPVKDADIILDFDNPNKFDEKDFRIMAKHNEIAGFNYPYVYLRLKIDSKVKIVQTGKILSFNYGRHKSVCFDDTIGFTDVVLIKPTYGKQIKLIVQGVELDE